MPDTFDLHIPTGELVGLLSDAIPFAGTDGGSTVNTVRLEWDGEMLHGMATDLFRVAIASWHPDDSPEGSARQDTLFARWGGTAERWATSLWLDDAKEVVKIFKLPPKQSWAPLQVTVQTGPGGTLTVTRRPESGHPAIRATFETAKDDYPDLRAMLVDAASLAPVDGLAFNATHLADYAKVRLRGPLELTFTGRDTAAHVRIGDRFVGLVIPVAVF